MTGIKKFDIANDILEGTNLIEASAGTGKTYTITGLFLRLILEKKLSVGEVLVVTFTEAATEELRERIRTGLRECLAVFTGEEGGDAVLRDLAERSGDDREGAIDALKDALRAFDQAAIFTIHGFCKRMLGENAFESGSLFDTELVADEEDLKREIVDDFWRRHFYRAIPLFVNYALYQSITPDNLFRLVSASVARSDLRIIPEVEQYSDDSIEHDFLECFNELRTIWQDRRTEIEAILLSDQGLNRTRYSKAKIPRWIREMDAYVISGANASVVFKEFKNFTASAIAASAKKDCDPVRHCFFDKCEEFLRRQQALATLYDGCILNLRAMLFASVRDELGKRKREKNVQSFDDLLVRLNEALEGKHGDALARAARTRFKAALIDEFQDTDPIQYAIFQKIFGGDSGTLFLIGDPKQAIYGFRGADVFTYMKAAGDAASRYTLDENWRSTPALITAVNTIFSQADRPFLYDEISFQPVIPAKKKDRQTSSVDDRQRPPFLLWYLNAGTVTHGDKPITKARADELIPGAVATEISRLLNQDETNGSIGDGSPFREEDIAVLVRTNREARMMQAALSARGIPAVLYSTGNLFDSQEALETERVLSAIAGPDDESLVRGALATDIMGVSGEELDRLLEDEIGWEQWLITLKRYHDLWNERSFIHMFRHLISEGEVLTRLMSYPDGERRNTNLIHLSEVLHRASVEKKLSMTGLLKWLSKQRDQNTRRLDEHQLRLESDERAVNLVTVHKSKGLEYPIVFCPFAWGGSRIKDFQKPFIFHESDHGNTLTLDLGSENRENNRIIAERELLAENIRLLYVALTRAKQKCYLLWGRFNGGETSAPAYLFHQGNQPETGDILRDIPGRFRELSDDEVLAELQAIKDKSEGTIRLSEIPLEREITSRPKSEETETLSCRRFSGTIDRRWRIASFTSLVSGLSHGSEIADYDAVGMADYPEQNGFEQNVGEGQQTDIFSFPRGAKAGTCLHDILQHLDFRETDPPIVEKLVDGKLKEYGFDLAWRKAIVSTIDKILSVPLGFDEDKVILSKIENSNRINEMEFYFPLKPVSPAVLKKIFEEFGTTVSAGTVPEEIEKLRFAPAKGFMRGFIDMVFRFQGKYYLVDWKSNHLGYTFEDYDHAALEAAMKEHFYVLQYMIYTMALNQYLKQRISDYEYEKHFGGVYYMFLRGIDPDKGPHYGIHRARPSVSLVDELCARLIPKRGEKGPW